MSNDFILEWNEPKHTFTGAVYEWLVDYAELNHEGGVARNGVVFTPRPWVYHAIENHIDVIETLKAEYQSTQSFDKALKNTCSKLSNAFTTAIESEEYEWEGVTRRRNGSVVTSPRDIVDQGGLRDSQIWDMLS